MAVVQYLDGQEDLEGGLRFACRDDARQLPATVRRVGQLADLSSDGRLANDEANETSFICTGHEVDLNGDGDTILAFGRCVA